MTKSSKNKTPNLTRKTLIVAKREPVDPFDPYDPVSFMEFWDELIPFKATSKDYNEIIKGSRS